jgi:tetratricopeptide (TPR) repeat protein
MDMRKTPSSRVPTSGPPAKLNRLMGWKAIAHYLGCTERTARRWESARALPVHRIPGGNRGSVWALPEQLQSWLEAHPPPAEEEPDDDEADVLPTAAAAPPVVAATIESAASPPLVPPPTASASKPWTFALSGVACAVLVTACVAFWKHARAPERPPVAAQTTVYDDNAAARSSYLDARFELSMRSAASLEVARTQFLALTEQFPARSAAWSGLADTYLLLREFGSLTETEAYANAQLAARKALALDPSLADAWLDSAFIDFWWNNDAASAFREFAAALKLDPASAKAHHWYATALQAHGDNDAALAAFARARTLDPESRAIVADEGWALFAAGRRSEGTSQLERLIADDPSFVDAQEWLARVYLIEGRDQDFLHAAKVAATLRGQKKRLKDLEVVAQRLGQGGRAAMLGQLADDAEQEWREGTGSAMTPAIYDALAGDRSAALKWLATAETTHDHSLNMVTLPVFNSYDQDPIYRNAVAQLR